jgi:hypothetical protein
MSGYHSSTHRRRNKSLAVPECDTAARQRCFDYLVGAIDEVWAQYCDCTQSAETVLYEVELPNSPESLCDDSANDSDWLQVHQPAAGRAGHRASVSEQPRSLRLMNLKKRLLNAKYFLEDLLGTVDVDAAAEFWSRWDMVKYAVVELVEEEADDDELVDEVCEDLERGRFYPMAYC